MNFRRLIATHDVLFITLDTLRYDVAVDCWTTGRTPAFQSVMPASGWEKRHTPGSFTYAAHAAFFAGFLPTPASPGVHPRLWALAFPGSETTTEETLVFDAPDIVRGFRNIGFRTICVGGVGFFNALTPLGNVFPTLFDESVWSPELGVTEPRSTEWQVDCLIRKAVALSSETRLFAFLNVSAIHQPNCYYLAGHRTDSCATQAAALAYVDGQLGRLFDAFAKRAPTVVIVCSDHGTAYGEDGYVGHRLAHPVVWDVPYAEFVLPHRPNGSGK